MRISGGIAKGRRTATKGLLSKTSDGEKLRPTSSKVREALFDIIRDRIEEASFVDLYAGTGTVGFEALSRGASRAIFVEPNDLRARTIKKNSDEFGFREKVQVVKNRAYKFLEKSYSEKEGFDIFFVDPPYHSEEIKKVLPMIGEKGLLNKSGVVIVEHFFKKKMPEITGELKIYRSYRYGDTMLTFYRKSVNK
ncbi:MAG: 16S rRNA (guanine(966)-N(2))-methyltransferase RsmD [Nitrospirae bacterium CG_4_10_14_0_8_um_filter_41_23]|nr:16S rRNA (guanine(966)-N(2))-methyltransferase RsmD [Nitrospirota bacterium]OIP61103.1 MAG: 16S rRNA (guanine(966)-N(2))-methyltransferase RsmD [Nitrospirae bacterium CG2_30_41_42]PIQ93812.1 MAG: 16S rRNA (guanine(966)-N(2))-methyltransferase RsmD [Nitrospirae bacterium CG11_big_fil_rev_8_21_14_0_20_41_14]PIV42414.1 MAG: 16S rRNA (guanine(966)-N(2))-methyltransferase RsmD [Nitrospirae bacterium CG02_land_8_20_14_3_00_41_53]PIW88319.1 MAG: 16S rRNA (guanine(966)-N(2))-methyltransferase RsmD [